MNDEDMNHDAHSEASGDNESTASDIFATPQEHSPAPRHHFHEDEPHANFNSADVWQFVELLRHRWGWVVFGGLICAGLGLVAGLKLWKPTFRASAQLIRNESPRTAEVFAYQTLTPQSFSSLLRSPELLELVGDLSNPPIPPDKLVKRLRMTPLRDGDVIQVETAGLTKEAAVELANLYTREAVRFTKQLQARAAGEVLQFVTPQLTNIEAEIGDLKNKEHPRPKAMPVATPLRPSPVQIKLQAAREELVEALTKYMDSHPVVQAARAKVESLQTQSTNSLPVAAPPSEAEVAGQFALQRDAWEMLRSELQPLETIRHDLLKRQNAAKLVSSEPPGYYRVLSPATIQEVKDSHREAKVAATSAMAGAVGFCCVALLALLVEVMDMRMKAPADVRRVTGLPLLATAPNLKKLPEAEQLNWAFRTWTALQGRFSPSLNHGLVCGITSAGHSEGRSTWIRLLSRAASEAGFRVLTVSAGQRHSQYAEADLKQSSPNGHAHTGGYNGQHNAPTESVMSSLPTPSEVAHHLIGPESQRVVHIPLPGWVWNLERRKQWQSALQEWSRLENVVILIELPPASAPEAVLLAEELPNLVWLTDSGNSKADETRAQLETLRHARCNLVGAVLNHAKADKVRKRLARWVPALVFPLLIPLVGNAQVETAATNVTAELLQPPPSTNVTLATAASSQYPRAPWQQKFTLGPGDILKISLYGSPEVTRPETIVGPDGRIGFLEAQDVMAAGLTIDELRVSLDKVLGDFRRAPRTMISPITLKSKKYAVLGKVVQRGVYSIDHPITMLEAIATAKGFELGMRERDSIDLVDLQKSFLMRNGKRVPINFEKMFLDGDLSQNVYIEPGDFLFFPPGGIKEVNVVGDVRYPGPVTFTPGLGVIAAISTRAGFNEKAYQSRVLVIRGSLENPQKFVVDTKAILAGKERDFALEPRDIIYVAKRPWWRAEELLDLAITAFLQSIVAATTGQELVQPFNPNR